MLYKNNRPESFDEFVGQEDTVKSIKNILAREKTPPDMIYVGPSGSGKTTMAYLVAKHYGYDFIEMNASDERRLEDVRTKIKRLAQTKGRRIVYLGEFDAMLPDAQRALRRIMENATSTTFILSCNEEWKVLDAIQSRCVIFRFGRLTEKQMWIRIRKILSDGGITMDTKDERIKEGLRLLLKESRGDMRKALNMIEKIVGEGNVITADSVMSMRSIDWIGDAISTALHGDFDSARQKVEDAYIMGNFSYQAIIDRAYEYLGNSNGIDPEIRVRLFERLSMLEERCRTGNSPIVQIVGYLSYCWIVPHLKKIGS